MSDIHKTPPEQGSETPVDRTSTDAPEQNTEDTENTGNTGNSGDSDTDTEDTNTQ